MQEGYEKRFTKGDIVFWCKQDGCRFYPKFGMVDEQFSDAVIVDYLAPRERRLVDGIPIDEFQSEQRYRKLPIGWTYNTELFKVSYAEMTDEEEQFTIDLHNPETVKEAYVKGFMVKDSEIFHGQIEADITREGFRIIKSYPMYAHHIDHTSIRPDKVYFTYEEAQREAENNYAELQRQAALSDYDWSVEQIDKTLKFYQNFTAATDNAIQQYRDFLLSMKNVEDIETRIFGGNIQWKYWKNKRWNYIELTPLALDV